MTPLSDEIRSAFAIQANVCARMGSPMTGAIVAAIGASVDHNSRVGQRLQRFAGDLTGTGEAVGLRLAGGLHMLARSGEDQPLAAAYAGEGDLSAAVRRAVADHDETLAAWLESPPQTNEVGRAAPIMAGLLAAMQAYPLPIDLLEMGSSAGLVLNMDRYRYDLGGTQTGDEISPLLLAPKWQGPPAPSGAIAILARRGVDRNPVYLAARENAERLIGYIWPDQPQRIANAERAIAIARAFPPPIATGEAADWVEDQLATPQAEGVLRILYHTVVFQYLDADQRGRVRKAIESAGAQVSDERPFGWLSMEVAGLYAGAITPDRGFELRLTLWPSGEERLLARVHPHGATVRWLG